VLSRPSRCLASRLATVPLPLFRHPLREKWVAANTASSSTFCSPCRSCRFHHRRSPNRRCRCRAACGRSSRGRRRLRIHRAPPASPRWFRRSRRRLRRGRARCWGRSTGRRPGSANSTRMARSRNRPGSCWQPRRRWRRSWIPTAGNRTGHCRGSRSPRRKRRRCTGPCRAGIRGR
jgi:hypothetical protein